MAGARGRVAAGWDDTIVRRIFRVMPDGPAPLARPDLPVHVYRLGTEPGDDLSDSTTAEERLAMMAILSERMWRLTGWPWPSYARCDIPIRVLRPE